MSFRRCCSARDVMLRFILLMFCFVRCDALGILCMDEMKHQDPALVSSQNNTPIMKSLFIFERTSCS